MISYSKNSPYFTTSRDQGYLDILSVRDISSQTDDILWTVTKKYEHRPDLLAFDLYDDQGLWWVFSLRNKSILKDPVFDLNAGVKIYLPKLSTLRTTLGI